jgi:molybdopterin-containing oxidoreductase family iron-sulfur binding subunit
MTRQWRSVAELERDPAFLARVAAEFPHVSAALAEPVGRRRVLKLMAASLALGGLAGCGDPAGPDQQIVPAVVQPPEIVPGLPNHYATASTALGRAVGVVVTHQMGRPIKVEGNPDHPGSLGGTDVFAQAALLDFYDPDRAGSVLARGVPTDGAALRAALVERRAHFAATRGAGLRVLTGSTTSPTLAARLDALLAQYPEAAWHQWDGIPRDEPRAAAVLAYGRAVEVVPRVAEADVILAIDSDLIATAPGHLAHARAFAARRNPVRTQRMSRVYAIEPSPTLIGAAADHRVIAHPRQMFDVVRALAAGVLRNEQVPDQFAALIADLKAAKGRALVHAGPDVPAQSIALVHAVNEALGGRGTTFDVLEPIEHRPADHGDSLRALVKDMHDGRVETLVVFGTNPVFTAPRSVGFAEALRRVSFVLALAPSANETTAAATWAVPQTHDWESWGDARAFDGTATIMQPQSLPLYGGWSPHALLSLLAGPDSVASRAAVRETWRDLDAAGWRAALAAGVVANTASARADVALRDLANLNPPAPDAGLTLLLRPDPNLWDGSHANNPWLQELPRPLSKLTWDNPLLISPATARTHGLVNGAEVSVTQGSAEVRLPVYMVPGQAPDVVVALMGYGREVVGSVGAGTGFNVFPLRDMAGPLIIQRTGRQHDLATTDHHNVLDVGPDGIVRHITLAQFFHGGPPAPDHRPTLYQPPAHSKATGSQQWGMSIDLNACIGCNACVIACQAENNIPVVGKAEVLNQREMHWLRIDRYYEGEAADPAMYLQPMLCMHCEEAPCEVVCPVMATLHDSEGLNLMVYNRCVGTRFCSNNCPYKVRRFNYGSFAREETRPALSRNPDVTVRARGVMEKCTYCVQRIAQARIAADIEDRPIRDGEIVTACQAACPTRALTFGDVADTATDVARHKLSPLAYALLADASTHPRTTYEAVVRNPNPSLKTGT